MKQRFILAHVQARQRAAHAVYNAPEGFVVTVQEPTRNLDQNALLWSLLNQISKQVVWHGAKLSDEEWKDVFSASLKKQKVVPGLDGGFVVCGQRTSRMSKRDFSELIELAFAFGAQQGVEFQEKPAMEAA
jgi:predicted RNA binding protein YcfA (HicA-like mRNA interferase family)